MMNTPKKLRRIDELFAFIATDADGERLPAFSAGSMMMQMVCADKARVDSLREEVEVIEP